MLDSTVITLSLKVFDWATYRNQKGAIKLHTLLDYDGCLPSYVCRTAGSQSDVRHSQYMILPAHSVVVYDEKQDRTIMILTNNFSWTAEPVAELYKQLWSIEIFFKELKQHLKIKSFIGTNENAMWIQIWTAMITMLLLRYMKEIAKYSWNLSNLVGFIRINLFVKMDLLLWLN
jgi:hypothetical protein